MRRGKRGRNENVRAKSAIAMLKKAFYLGYLSYERERRIFKRAHFDGERRDVARIISLTSAAPPIRYADIPDAHVPE